MRHQFLLLVSCVLLFAVSSDSSLFAKEGAKTVAHQWLKDEFHAMQGAPDSISEEAYEKCIARLDFIIDECVKAIGSLTLPDDDVEAIKMQFDAVDRVLVENDYVCFIKTNTLIETLTPGVPEEGGSVVLTDRMRQRALERPEGTPVYRFDCDTGSILFLAVFEKLGKPVVMVETPGHNFVRWRIGKDRHVNWDVNDGASYTDDEHRSGRLRTSSGFPGTIERLCHYLQDMTPGEVKAYHKQIVADLLLKARRYSEAKKTLESSIKDRPWASTPKNNLAWNIATHKELQYGNLTSRAVKLALHAVALDPKDRNVIDTLAAAYAANGQFQMAFHTEMLGNRNPDRLLAYATEKNPADLGWEGEAP